MPSKTINSVTEYIELIEDIRKQNVESGNRSDLIFRGQPQDKSLRPKIARLNLKGDLAEIEKMMLHEFERRMLPLSEFKPENKWDLLALAQNHGLPTRLLDWSYNALIALWFAVAKPAKRKDEGDFSNGIVYILNIDINDFNADLSVTDPLRVESTTIFRSTVVSRRISSQDGLFTIHKLESSGEMISLEKTPTFEKKITKVVIPHTMFPDFRKQLDVLGVNCSTTFPDIDGLCRHLQWRYAYYKDEIPKNNDQPPKLNTWEDGR